MDELFESKLNFIDKTNYRTGFWTGSEQFILENYNLRIKPIQLTKNNHLEELKGDKFNRLWIYRYI